MGYLPLIRTCKKNNVNIVLMLIIHIHRSMYAFQVLIFVGFFFVHSQVLISNGKAVGVEYLQNGRREVVGANKEVILAAGPINTPHLLILSGVGPKDHLLDHKVA